MHFECCKGRRDRVCDSSHKKAKTTLGQNSVDIKGGCTALRVLGTRCSFPATWLPMQFCPQLHWYCREYSKVYRGVELDCLAQGKKG